MRYPQKYVAKTEPKTISNNMVFYELGISE